MRAQPIDFASELISLDRRRCRRQDALRQRPTRRLLLAPIRVEPESRGIAAFSVVDQGEYCFVASPRLSEVEIQFAAYACAYRLLRSGDDVCGISSAPRKLLRILAKHERDAEQWTRERCPGEATEPAAA